MNALALWIPGTLLLIVGAGLLATGRVELVLGIAIIGVGVSLETLGTLLWVTQRRADRK